MSFRYGHMFQSKPCIHGMTRYDKIEGSCHIILTSADISAICFSRNLILIPLHEGLNCEDFSTLEQEGLSEAEKSVPLHGIKCNIESNAGLCFPARVEHQRADAYTVCVDALRLQASCTASALFLLLTFNW